MIADLRKCLCTFFFAEIWQGKKKIETDDLYTININVNIYEVCTLHRQHNEWTG